LNNVQLNHTIFLDPPGPGPRNTLIYHEKRFRSWQPHSLINGLSSNRVRWVHLGVLQPNIKRLEEKRNIKGLVKALDHKWYPIRKEAAEALYRLKDECSLEVWAYALGNDSSDVHRCAMTALSEMGDARALDLLMDVLRKGENSGDAGRAIGTMGDARAIGPLV